MTQRSVQCTDCGRKNRLPEGFLIEARCGRCETALTYYTWVAAGLRSRGLIRGVQVIGGLALLTAIFGGDLVAWWESEPFRLNVAPAADAEASVPDGSLAADPLAQSQD